MSLPYQNSVACPVMSQGRINAILRKFGVSRIIFDDDIKQKIIKINFIFNSMPVSIPVDFGKLAQKFIEQKPYNNHRRMSEEDYLLKVHSQAHSAAYSLIEDMLRAKLSIINLGINSFEQEFLGNFVNRNGEILSEILLPKLQEFIDSKFQLTDGKQ